MNYSLDHCSRVSCLYFWVLHFKITHKITILSLNCIISRLCNMRNRILSRNRHCIINWQTDMDTSNLRRLFLQPILLTIFRGRSSAIVSVIFIHLCVPLFFEFVFRWWSVGQYPWGLGVSGKYQPHDTWLFWWQAVRYTYATVDISLSFAGCR